ncbi:MAG: signal peptidase I, partial [Moraxella osloensis]|nr:signal peptidase I [Moraxella osloensis]
MTFEDILLGLSVFALLVVLWDKFQSKGEMFAEGKKDGIVLDYSKSLLPVLLVVLVVRSFAYEPFRIPSGSMYPTLEIGDFILVEKFTYGLRLPSFYHYGLQWSEPQRGDVVVFRYPNDPSTDFIKRVIALPGDEIQVINRQIYVNGQKADQRVLGEYEG